MEALANGLSPTVYDTPPVSNNMTVLGHNMSPVVPLTWKLHGVAMPPTAVEGDNSRL
jgi:hypothetical protein